jgi:hypothetical protein
VPGDCQGRRMTGLGFQTCELVVIDDCTLIAYACKACWVPSALPAVTAADVCLPCLLVCVLVHQPVARLMRQHLEPMLLKYQVDLALYGHHHSYQRCAGPLSRVNPRHTFRRKSSWSLAEYRSASVSRADPMPVRPLGRAGLTLPPLLGQSSLLTRLGSHDDPHLPV